MFHARLGGTKTILKLDAERPVPRNHTPRTTGDHSGPTESDWASTDCLLRTSSNDPSRRGGQRKSARERGLYRLQRCRVGARAFFCTGIAKNMLSGSTPFGAPTAGIASSRRDLTIRRSAAWIADVGESGKARGRGVCSEFNGAGLARGRCCAPELRKTGFPRRRHSVARQHGLPLLDEI